jgi:fatty-acyl-CoA synthase
MTQTRTDDSIEKRVSTVGRALPEIEIKIVDPETGETLPPGRQGEICCRGYNIMKGYYKMPDMTEKAIDSDGWLHSGDLAAMDEDGYYMITGRIKDMIIRGGENIYPMEIEEFLRTISGVRDVQVVGIPDEKYGEIVGAFVIPEDDAHLTEEDIRDYSLRKIARYKVPKHVFIVGEYPLTASGKIQKFKLREMAVDLLKQNGDPA